MKGFSIAGYRGVLLGAGLFLCVSTALGEEDAKPKPKPKPVYIGSVRGDYVFRKLGEYDDHDAYGYWYFRGRNMADKRVEIYTSGRLNSDLDGTTSSYDDPFRSIDDDSDVRLLQLYADIHDPKQRMTLRLGRQYVDVADYIQMDGVQGMLFENESLGGRVFMGRPVSEYSSTSGDSFVGASVIGRPWQGNVSRATYARYDDTSENAADDHYFIDLRQQFMEEIRLRSYLSVMNEDVRMGGADLFYISMSDRVLDAMLGIQRWGDYNAGTRAYSPLTEVLGDLEPFTTAYGRFTTETGYAWLYFSPGAMVRVPDTSDFTNRGFERYDMSFILEPIEALSATVALEYWDVEDDDRFFGLSGDIRYRHRKLWELVLGAAYLDYSYLQLADQSVITDDNQFPALIDPQDGTRVRYSPDAFTYYLRGKINITRNTTLRVSGEIEDDGEESDPGYRVRASFEVRL
jgi:hypothetical protein